MDYNNLPTDLKDSLLRIAIAKIARYYCSCYRGTGQQWFEELLATKRLLRSMPADEVLEMADSL